jgi:hypothetical protein
MDRIKLILTEILKSLTHKVRTIASVLQNLISLEPALGKSVLVGTRLATITVVVATEVTEMSKRKRNPWETTITLDSETMEVMAGVVSQLDSWNGFPVQAWHTRISLSSIIPFQATATLDRKIPARRVHNRRAIRASEASDFAVALYSVEVLPDFSFSEDLKESEQGESSLYRELLAIDQTFGHISTAPGSLLKLSEWTTLWWLTDNQNVEKMLAKGSRKLKITRLVLKMLKEGQKLMYNIQPIWFSRDNPYLQKADCLSKGIGSDNWEITDFDYAHLDAQFGPFLVDLFSLHA